MGLTMVASDGAMKNFDLQHIAIIMDGNGRWAQQRDLPRIAGHQRGVETVTSVVDDCLKRNIRYLSLFAFSSENWGRPQEEVDALMGLLQQFLASQRQKMLDAGICLRVIGDLGRMSSQVRNALDDVCTQTASGEKLTLTLALSYGGRGDIVRAVRKMAQQVAAGQRQIDDIDECSFAPCLDNGDLPDPDLLIRTSGEQRISNFFLWQAAYSELYFCDTLWPDFSGTDLQQAIDAYLSRKRRFGLTDEQLA